MTNVGNKTEDFKFTDVKINVLVDQQQKEIAISELQKILGEKMIEQGTAFRDHNAYSLVVDGRVLTQAGDLELFAQNLNFFMNKTIYCNPATIFKVVVELGAVRLIHTKNQ